MHEPLSQIPADLVSLSDYERYARQLLAHSLFEYIAGGGADELTLQRNRTALDRISLLPRVLRDVTAGSTHTRVLDEDLRHPILLAPVAFQRMVHPDGELATARAADALDTPMVVSTLASHSLEDIATETRAGKWFQLYFQQDPDFTLTLVRRAERAGYSKLVVTVDAPLHGIRNRAQRAGFVLPDDIEAVNLRERPPLPRAVLEPSQSIVFQGMMSEAPGWEQLEWLSRNTHLPIIVKGVLHPQDAIRVAGMGLAGVIVSNHGGRALDCVPSATEMLPQIRAATGPNFTLLLDGGISRGTDVFKALALGANAVLIGRPQIYALAVAGAVGVAHMLRVLREELEVTMALAGTPRISDITSAALYQNHL
uniref:alpha-hydroxy acid oxidase n=1 Tax=Marinobacterium profundum TaxID=1714300 RepID=UPI0008366B7C|nr:alpha-hydroxy acid oxidase [Marinobacterium profundum]